MQVSPGLGSAGPANGLASRPPGVLRISLDGAPARERPDRVRQFFQPLGIRYDSEPLDEVPFEVDLTLHNLPDLLLVSGQAHGARNRRTREGGENFEDVGLVVNLNGPHLLTQRGQDIVLGDGEATLVSMSEPFISVQRPPGRFVTLRCPRPRLAALLRGSHDRFFHRISPAAAPLRLLTQYSMIVRNEQSASDRALQHVMAAHLYDLMALTLGATKEAGEIAQDRGLRAARLSAIKQDIAKNLERADLSVVELAGRHCCTPRFVQRLFEHEGTTFTEYVLAQRLAPAHLMLTDPRRGGEKIINVAYDCGFGDLSWFSRAFRRRYGMAPSDLRAQARDASGKSG
jgi:AraC-like DNA-binding protein